MATTKMTTMTMMTMTKRTRRIRRMKKTQLKSGDEGTRLLHERDGNEGCRSSEKDEEEAKEMA